MTEIVAAKRRRFRFTAYLFTVACCNLVLIFQAAPKLRSGYQDFVIYYGAGRNILEGRAHLLYNLANQYRTQLTFANVPIRQEALPYNHPPFEAVFFVPLALLRFWPAYVVWTALNLAMLAAIVILLRRYPSIRNIGPGLGAAAVLAFFPLINGLLQGQDVILLLFLAVMALVCLERNADAMAGACLGAGLYRPHIAVPLMLLLAVRRWRIVLGFIPVGLLLLVVTVAVTGWEGPLTYVRFVFFVEKLRVGNFGPHVVPNLRGLAGSLLGHFPKPVIEISILASSIAVLAAAARRIRKGQDSLVYIFCLACVTTLLVCFHALSYDLTLLLPFVLFLLGAALTKNGGRHQVVTNLLLFILFLTPLYIYLNFEWSQFFWFAFVILWLYFRLLAMPAPVVEPA